MQSLFRLALCAALLLTMTWLGAGTAAAQQPDQQRIEVDIPAQPLDQAVTELARQAGLAIGGNAALLRGKQAPALDGEYTPREALDRLLAGSGVTTRFSGDDTITLMPADDAEDDSPMQLAPIEVTGGEAGYAAARSYAATRTTAPVMDTPVSVQVVPRQVIVDQAAQGLEDVFTNISGVVESGNTLNAQSEVRPVIRGFEAQRLFRNGLRSTNVGSVDLINIQSVEVLKGPASVLFGAIEPGGILNYNTKKPMVESAHEVTLQAGRYDHFRATIDSTGPLNTSRTLRYRLNAAYTDSDSFRDFVDTERVAVAPSLLFVPGDRTELLLDFSFTREEVPFDSGVPFSVDDEPLVSDDTFFGDPALDGQKLEDYFASYQLQHQFNEVFALRNQFSFHRVDARNETIRNRGVTGAPEDELLSRRFQNLESIDDEFQVVTDLSANFQTGMLDHDVLAGVDFVYQDQDQSRFRQNLAPIPINDNPPTAFTPPQDQPQEIRELENRWVAVYLQDQVSLLDDRLHLLAGLRFDDFHSEFREDGQPSPEVDESELTGRIGALYEITPWLAPFASFSRSFNPQASSAVDASNNILPPEEGIQYEGGIKVGPVRKGLVATIAAFRIEKDNVAVFDLPVFLETGEVAFTSSDQRSKGVEVDVSGQLTEALRLIANYAYTNTEILENRADPSLIGRALGNVPDHSVRIWAAYEFFSGSPLQGLGLGAGLRHESDRRAQFDDTQLDAFTTLDAAVWYERSLAGGKAIRAQVNIENLTDKRFFPRASDQSIVHPGEPLNVRATITLTF